MGDRRLAWLLILTPLLVLGPILFSGQALGLWEAITPLVTGQQMAAYAPWDVLWADSALQFHPWRELVFESWRAGEVPVWNHFSFGGAPLLANSQSGALYPPHIVAAFLPVATSTAILLLAWFHLALLGVGVARLAEASGAKPIPAIIAGALVQFSPFVLTWLPLASVVTTVAWIPWLLLFALRWWEARQARQIAGAALCAGMLLLAGHLQFAAYGLFALVVVGISIAVLDRKTGSKALAVGLAGLIAVPVLGGLLAAPQLIPVLQASQQSHRQNKPSAEGFAAYQGGAAPSWMAAATFSPGLTGWPGKMTPADEQAGSPALANYWPALSQRGLHMGESALIIAPLAAIGLFGLRRRREDEPADRRGVWIGLAGLSALMTFGTPFNALLYYGVPGWSATGSPGRAAILAVLALAILAAIGLSRVADAKDQKRVMIGGAALVLLGLLVAKLTLDRATFWLDPSFALGPTAARTFLANLPLLVASLAFAVAAVSLRSRPPLTLAFGLASIVVATFMLQLPRGTVPPKAEADFVRRAFITPDWSLLYAAPAALPPNTSILLRQHDIAGYDSMITRQTVERLRTINAGNDPAPPANGNMMLVKPNFDAQALADAGVTEIWSGRPMQNLGPEVGRQGQFVKYALPGPGRVSHSAGSARIVRESANRLEIEVDGPGTVTLRDSLPANSTFEFSGKPLAGVQRSSTAGTSIEVPGPGVLVIRYGLEMWPTVWLFPALAAATLVGLVLRRPVKVPADQPPSGSGSLASPD